MLVSARVSYWSCSAAEQRRKHAPISYKPPERQTSGTKQDEPTEEARKALTTDRKDSAGKPGLEQQTSGLDRSVSRTESGHKLSVFERLRRYVPMPATVLICACAGLLCKIADAPSNRLGCLQTIRQHVLERMHQRCSCCVAGLWLSYMCQAANMQAPLFTA